MANSDVLVRMKADTQNYDANIAKARRQLDQFKRDNLSLGGAMKQASTQIIGMAAQFASVTAAVKLVGDALKKNEQILDEWGRTTEAASAIFDSFVNSLNTGDFSGFLSNIRDVINAARDAYDAMDALGTFNAFNQINLEKARTGLTESIANFREGTGSKADVQAAGKQLQEELATRMKYEQNEYIKRIQTLAETKKIDADLLQKALSGSYGDYETLKNMQLTGSVKRVVMQGKKAKYVDEAAPGNETEKVAVALQQLNDTELRDLQALGAQAQRTATEIEQINRQVIRATGGGNVSGAGAEAATTLTYADDSIKAQEAKVAELTKLWKEASAELRDGYYAQLQKAKSELEEMTKGPLTELKGQMAFAVEPVKIKIDTSNLKLAKNDAQGMRDAFSAAASAVATVGGALQQIEDPAAKVAGIIAAAIAQVALTFASSLKGTIGPWDWIAAATAGLATMISTITAIKSVTAGSYANGGIVPGNNHNDGLIANVSSGELILNQAQQNNVAAALTAGNGGGGGMSQPYLTGDVILLGVNNYLGRSGQGEIVTTSMLRRAGIRL